MLNKSIIVLGIKFLIRQQLSIAFYIVMIVTSFLLAVSKIDNNDNIIVKISLFDFNLDDPFLIKQIFFDSLSMILLIFNFVAIILSSNYFSSMYNNIYTPIILVKLKTKSQYLFSLNASLFIFLFMITFVVLMFIIVYLLLNGIYPEMRIVFEILLLLFINSFYITIVSSFLTNLFSDVVSSIILLAALFFGGLIISQLTGNTIFYSLMISLIPFSIFNAHLLEFFNESLLSNINLYFTVLLVIIILFINGKIYQTKYYKK